MATIPRKGVPSNVPLAFALGGTNGLVATLLELEFCPPQLVASTAWPPPGQRLLSESQLRKAPAIAAATARVNPGLVAAAAAAAAAGWAGQRTSAAAAAAAAAAGPSTLAAGSGPMPAENRLATLEQLATAVQGLQAPAPPVES